MFCTQKHKLSHVSLAQTLFLTKNKTSLNSINEPPPQTNKGSNIVLKHTAGPSRSTDIFNILFLDFEQDTSAKSAFIMYGQKKQKLKHLKSQDLL